MTTTEKSQQRRQRKMERTSAKPRNVGIGDTIQALKLRHAQAGGSHFHPHSQTHGHPIGRYFIESEGRSCGKRFYVRALTQGREGGQPNDTVATVAGPLLTHAGAMAVARSMGK